MKRWIAAVGGIFLLAIIGLAILGVTFLYVKAVNEGEVQIVNRSQQKILTGGVEICGQKFRFEVLDPGENKFFTYKVKGDSHYSIDIKFSDGRIIKKNIGYVTTGANFKDILFIDERDLLFKRLEVSNNYKNIK